MQLWFSRGSEVPLRDQMVTQIVLGILSGDLAPGERLPSTRELARRFHLHPNTASAGYRKLEREHWVEVRHGSGVYVRDKRFGDGSGAGAASDAENVITGNAAARDLALDQIVAGMFQSARRLGVPAVAVRARLRRWLAVEPPDHFLLIESDAALARIVLAEMRCAVKLPVEVAGIEEMRGFAAHAVAQTAGFHIFDSAIAVVLPSKAEMVRPLLPPETQLLVLQVRSIRSSLAKYLPARSDQLVAVASGWPDFLTLAHTMLVAAGFDTDSIVLRNCRDTGWRDGLDEVAAVVCDSVTAGELGDGWPDSGKLGRKPMIIPFSLLAESSLEELRRCERLVLQSDLSAPGADPR